MNFELAKTDDFNCSEPKPELKIDNLVKSRIFPFFSMFWVPDQVRHDGLGTYYETIQFVWYLLFEIFNR